MTHFVPGQHLQTPPSASNAFSHGGGGGGGNLNVNPFGANPFGGGADGSMVMTLATDYINRNFVEEGKAKLSAIETSELRRRFAVTHEYVLQKLKILAFPFRHKFGRGGVDREAGGGGGLILGDETPPNADASLASSSPTTSPANDINAPDLYLPLMSLITYVVFCAFGKGLTASQLNPTDLATTVTACVVLVVIETIAIKLWRMVTSLPPPALFDTAAVFGYFFVSVCYALLGRALFNSWLPPAAWAVSLYNTGAFCFFVYKTLGESFLKDGAMPKRAIPILYGATIAQAPLFLWFVARAY